MRTINQRDVRHVFVGKYVSGALGPDINSLVDGEIGLFGPDGARLSNTTFPAVDKFRVGKNVNGEILASEFIPKAAIEKIVNTPFAPAVEQNTYIGYDGTSGAIVANSDTVYRVSLMIKELITQNHGGVYVKDMTYKSDATATQEEIALGLVKSGIANMAREAEIPVRIRAISNASAPIATFSVTANEGSQYVVTTAAHGLAVGDFIVIGGGHYKVEAVPSATELKLFVPYQGPTVTAGACSTYGAATGAAANWGIWIEGKPLGFALGKVGYRKSRWKTAINADAFGATPLSETPAFEGTGVYEQIAEEEWFSRGNFGEFYRKGEPNLFAQSFAASPLLDYEQWFIKVVQQERYTLTTVNDLKEFVIAIPTVTPNWASDATYGVSTLLATL